MSAEFIERRTISSEAPVGRGTPAASNVNDRGSRDAGYFHGVTGGTLSVAGGMSTVLKSAGLTISRYSMSGE